MSGPQPERSRSASSDLCRVSETGDQKMRRKRTQDEGSRTRNERNELRFLRVAQSGDEIGLENVRTSATAKIKTQTMK